MRQKCKNETENSARIFKAFMKLTKLNKAFLHYSFCPHNSLHNKDFDRLAPYRVISQNSKIIHILL